ncbi:anthranilate synthase component II [Anaerosacchariphilus polymeriproducens]|uniref:Aminodeoxychorismate/anthranilate synthase component II n=1 Tax=Anaerosacchariphilus polymeriproducens TaxID=1812858 RepID=A0A371AV63_9FIRM|nr:aminodeoxychorismate/anthranilate synthase component II [Anaerosacchariphilus polymeriproducens]RDU23465.1 aminodeoxychorismate/anthranilate synthase component II [Anaerosacchariphilus polymeriproducens]
MVLLIDNYDSFSYNLYQLVGELDPDIKVIRNDELTIEEIEHLNPSSIIISPGPGKPKDAGICIDVVKHFSGKIPILGVCLGHQVIYEAFSGVVTYAQKLMHGKQSEVEIISESPLFQGMKKQISVARYHSLAADERTLPNELNVTAKTASGEIMAIQHKVHSTYGLQFHPESILTPQGKEIIRNFMR